MEPNIDNIVWKLLVTNMLACSECKKADIVLLGEVVYQMVVEQFGGCQAEEGVITHYKGITRGLGLTLVIVSLLLNPSLLTDCT